MNDLSQRLASLSPEQKLLLKVQLGKKRGVPEPIAIIGIGCRFPGANHTRAYWQLLQAAKDAIGDVPADRWPLYQFYDRDPSQPGKHYCRQGGFLDQVDQFDPEFFGIAPREAAYIDPQQRLMLEVLWEALEDAALPADRLSGTKTGVFVGASTLDYGQLLLQQPHQIVAYTTTGLASTMLANRVSYLLNFQGPSLTVDTACSSSLVAVHLACQSLWQGESTLALAGGVNIMLTPALTIGFSKLTALSPDGRCKAFDASANGFVRAEGAGVVVLKPLSQAVADGDRIYALIRGGAINQDGRTNGLTAPNREAQEQVLRDAYRQARVPLEQVSYIEAHGTGTLLGDPIEARALGQVFSQTHSPDRPIRLGSVKSNIGHTEAAAGVASLIKVALALKHRQWVPSLHFHQPNPYIPFDQLPLQVQTELQPWVDWSDQTIAGVSSFGFGGTNAHVVLQAPPELPVKNRPETPASHMLTLSAHSEESLRALARRYLSPLQGVSHQDLGDICYTANTGRTAFPYRLAALATTPEALHQNLSAFAAGQPASALHTALPVAEEEHTSVWLFTGQGSQYPDMGRQLYQTQPVFRAALQRCNEILQNFLDESLLQVMYPSSASDQRLHQTIYTQPALFALEYALAELWSSWGMRPAAVMGHSVGEYVAACVAGVFTLEEGLKLIAQRGKLMQSLPETGMMAAVMTDSETVAKSISPYGNKVAIATLNGPKNTVIAGVREAVEAALQEFEQRKIPVTSLTVSHAFHSPLMDPILNLFEHTARQISFKSPRIPLVSNLTGTFVAPGEVPDASYWRRHAREPVRFSEGMATLRSRGYRHFLEIGPHPVLSTMGRRCLKDAGITWLPSLRRGHDNWQTLLLSLGQLYCQGFEVNWQTIYGADAHQKRSLPTYPFQRRRYWVDLPSNSAQATKLAGPASTAYALDWQRCSVAAPTSRKTSESWLIFCEQDHLWQALNPVLKERGIVPIRVTQGQTFAQLQPYHFQMDLRQNVLLETVLTALEEPDRGPLTTVLYWAPSETEAEAVTRPVLALLQALTTQPSVRPPKLWLLTANAQSVATENVTVAPWQALLWGLGRTLRLEHPELWGGLVDLTEDEVAPAGSMAQPAWVQTLVNHILAQDCEDEAAIRQGMRWVPRLQPVPLKPDYQETDTVTSPIRSDVTYLITGGTGGLGQWLTRWLVGQGARHLVLLSRRGYRPDLEPLLTPLEHQGATIWVEAVDVADGAALGQLLDRIQHQLPPLKGIFHAAGVLADGFLLNQTWEQFQQVMPAKLRAAWHLHQLTQSLDLDWFVLFSSIASLLGSPGQGNYSAANAGLDALTLLRRQQNFPALSISWGPWQDAGMAVDHQQTTESWAQRGMAPLAVEDGLRWLNTLMSQSSSLPRSPIGVACINWERLQHYLPTLPPVMEAVASASARPSGNSGQGLVPAVSTLSQEAAVTSHLQRLLALPEAERVSELLSYFQTQVAKVMGLQEKVPIDRPLLDLGIDSLMTMDLLALCKQDLQLVLYPREVMTHPTVSALAQYVAQELVRVHQPQLDMAVAAEPNPPGHFEASLPNHPWQPAAPLEKSTPLNDSMIFLLSAPRSGSTLLRVMLAGHPDLFCPPELHLLPFNTLQAQQSALGSSYLQEGLQRALMELLQFDADQAQALLDEWSQHQLTVPQVYDKLQQTAAPRLLVDKSPTYSFSLETLERAEQIFSRAKYIHLVRHPYAVMDSFVRNRMHKIFDLTTAAPYQLAEQVWQTSNDNIATFLQRLEPSRHLRLRYEDLVADPETAMEQVCAFLGLSFDSAVLNPYEGRRMTDGVRAQSLAVDDPNFRRRDRIDPSLAQVWQSIQLPHFLSIPSQTLAQQYNYTLPREVPAFAPQPESPSVAPLSLPPNYVPLALLQEEYIPLRGRETCICHWGSGNDPRIVALHGILEHGAAWEGVAVRLAQQGYHVIAPDLRGHGRSAHAGDAGGYQLVDFLGDMDSFTQGLTTRNQPLVLVGHSMGAVLSAVLTSLRPERFSHLVLIEPVVPAAVPSNATADQLTAHLDYLASPPSPVVMPSMAVAVKRIQTLKPKMPVQAAQKMAERLTRPIDGGVCWRWDPRLQARTTLSLGGGLIDRQGYGQLLQNITVPTTVIVGRDSQFNRPEDIAFLAQHLPRARRLTLPGGHDLPSETPGELAQIIQALIQEEHR